MSLTKEVTADKIEVVTTENGPIVQVRVATKIMENGEAISSSYHRHVITCDCDYSAEEAHVQAICAALFAAPAEEEPAE